MKRAWIVLSIIATVLGCKHNITEPKTFACGKMQDVFEKHAMPFIVAPEGVAMSNVDFATYCRSAVFDTSYTLNPKRAVAGENEWHLSPGSGLMISVLPLDGVHRPWVKNVTYKEAGSCQLGMNIYVKDLADLGKKTLKPLIFVHGGAWTYRKITGSLAIDALAPQLTELGYVVFSPSYQLIKGLDGPEECRNKSGGEILQDMRDAFAWVRAHADEYGFAPAAKVDVVGQSAGGHLAAFLMTEFPSDVHRGLLFYPVADFGSYLNLARTGGLDQRYLDKTSILLNFIDQKAMKQNGEQKMLHMVAEDPVMKALVQRNSFPEWVAKDPQNAPPAFIIWGTEDRYIPGTQVSRMCAAYAGKDVSDVSMTFADAYLQPGVNMCGKSKLHVLKGAEHMFDLKCFSRVFSGLVPDDFLWRTLCPSGNTLKDSEAKSAIQSGFKFLTDP